MTAETGTFGFCVHILSFCAFLGGQRNSKDSQRKSQEKSNVFNSSSGMVGNAKGPYRPLSISRALSFVGRGTSVKILNLVWSRRYSTFVPCPIFLDFCTLPRTSPPVVMATKRRKRKAPEPLLPPRKKPARDEGQPLIARGAHATSPTTGTRLDHYLALADVALQHRGTSDQK